MKKFMILLMAMAMVVVACKKDDEETPEPTFQEKLVGTYAFTSGTFNNPVTVNNLIIPTGDTLPVYVFEAGSDASAIVGGVLLSDSPCTDPTKTAIEMRDDFKLYTVCIGESNEDQMGTWDTEGNDKITLNVSTSFGTTVAVQISSVVITDTKMTGNIETLPMPIDMLQPLGATNMQFANVAVVFTKLP